MRQDLLDVVDGQRELRGVITVVQDATVVDGGLAGDGEDLPRGGRNCA